jgi:hypothetical protein
MGLTFSVELAGGGRLTGTSELSTNSDSIRFGTTKMPKALLTLATGTGTGQGNVWWSDQRTLATATNENLDLNGALTNAIGQALALTKVNFLFVAIVAPDGVKKLRVGPGTATPFALPWGGTAPYVEVIDWLPLIVNRYGYAVGAGATDTINVANPTAVSVTYNVWVVGSQ